jgi:signal transduction histidine kinase
MSRHSLRRVLAVQWALYTAMLLAGVGGIGALALYDLEDGFINARLIEAERALSGERAPLPQVELWRPEEFPESHRARVAALAPGRMREFRLDEARYVHVRAVSADASGPRLLVYDVQNEMRVNAVFARGAPLLALMAACLLALAAWLARRNATRIERAAGGLLGALARGTDPHALRHAADTQPVSEFQHLGHALADALDARLDALRREEDTLRFIAHELRTPLQSAKLADAALPGDTPAHQRLKRALQRLERASLAVLWLGESTPAIESTDVAVVARTLADEFAPLAIQRRQLITCTLHAPLEWPLPAAAAEALLSNLLLNAIQHGSPGPVALVVDADAVVVDNPCTADSAQPGYGLGLELARRITTRIGWSFSAEASAGHHVTRVSAPPRNAKPTTIP